MQKILLIYRKYSFYVCDSCGFTTWHTRSATALITKSIEHARYTQLPAVGESLTLIIAPMRNKMLPMSQPHLTYI